MAMIKLPPELSCVIKHAFMPSVRYRCLVLQVNDLSLIAAISNTLIDNSSCIGAGNKPIRLAATEFLDDVGALSCETVLDNLDKQAKMSFVVLTGPLHFLDYWSPSLQASFWAHLSSFSEGHGIVIVDTLRTKGIDGCFSVVCLTPEPRIRVLKSRLAATEVRAL